MQYVFYSSLLVDQCNYTKGLNWNMSFFTKLKMPFSQMATKFCYRYGSVCWILAFSADNCIIPGFAVNEAPLKLSLLILLANIQSLKLIHLIYRLFSMHNELIKKFEKEVKLSTARLQQITKLAVCCVGIFQVFLFELSLQLVIIESSVTVAWLSILFDRSHCLRSISEGKFHLIILREYWLYY